MPAFRTPVHLPDYPFALTHQDRLLSMGSCFAGQLAGRMQRLKFEVVHNPFGISYHPDVLAQSIFSLLEGRVYEQRDLFEQQGRWCHFDFHGSYAGECPEDSLRKMNASVEQARGALSEVSLLVITFGTAYGWWHKPTARIVANCHRLPGQEFERRLVGVEAMASRMAAAITGLKAVNPGLRCLFTVSPVRHIRDGLSDNQLSKASLRLLAHQLCERLPESYYFPAYELMVDDLRDYRFYAADMIHPSAVAIDYIWEQFRTAFFGMETLNLLQAIHQINQGLAHRPQYPGSEAHLRFQRKLLQQMESLEQQYDFISFLSEKAGLLL